MFSVAVKNYLNLIPPDKGWHHKIICFLWNLNKGTFQKYLPAVCNTSRETLHNLLLSVLHVRNMNAIIINTRDFHLFRTMYSLLTGPRLRET